MDLHRANEALRREIDGLRHTNDMLRYEIDILRHKAASAPNKLIRYHDADEYEVEIKPESTRFSIIWGGGLQDASFPAETMNLGSLRDRYNTIADVMAGGHDEG